MSRLEWVDHVLVGDFFPGRRSRRYGSILLLLIAIACGFLEYSTGGLFSRSVNLRPDMVSMLVAIFLVGSLHVRRIVPWSTSVFSLLSMVLNATVTAIFVQAILGGGATSFFSVPMPFIIGVALAVTWLGMRPLAPIGWGVVLLLGFWNVQMVSEAMGLYGYVFMVCAFLGVLLQFDFDVDSVLSEIRYDFVGISSDDTNQIGGRRSD